ncbi:MAG: nucleotidyl transferase AbiEii/AbiGii toxin family protein [Gammaproteobacteria bacterium]|nr:nucleotidyl transferase AbiEii/AbiGii toxin family protein [Gammaproteobacteria bacterium]
MAEYRRPRHRIVARVLDALDAGVLAITQCYFGGGTRLALELDEYRESADLNFICSDLAGYRTLRATIDNRSLGELIPKSRQQVSLLRDVRADQYGIRTVLGVEGEPLKFEIILEARIQVAATTVKGIPVPVLDRTSCFVEKWLANADRWNDQAVLSRDAIDLAFMLSAWKIDEAFAGAELAGRAYGDTIGRAARAASTKLLEDTRHRKQCTESLAVTDSKRLVSGLKLLAKVAKKLELISKIIVG